MTDLEDDNPTLCNLITYYQNISLLKNMAMGNEKALINDRLRVSRPTYLILENFAFQLFLILQ